ncbi:MAG: hypothetical protein AAGI17_00685 [Planctomycetota bacterium]
MTKSLVKFGNEVAVVLDPEILASLGIDENTSVEISIEGDCITITPARDRDAPLADAIEQVNDRFEDDLRRLAE